MIIMLYTLYMIKNRKLIMERLAAANNKIPIKDVIKNQKHVEEVKILQKAVNEQKDIEFLIDVGKNLVLIILLYQFWNEFKFSIADLIFFYLYII